MIGLAKEYEMVYKPGESMPLVLPKNSQALFLLQRIRDEVHRFSVTYHRTVRGKNSLTSALDDIPGIGPSRRKDLLKRFGSVQMLKEAALADIAAAPSMNRTAAAAVYEALHADDDATADLLPSSSAAKRDAGSRRDAK